MSKWILAVDYTTAPRGTVVEFLRLGNTTNQLGYFNVNGREELLSIPPNPYSVEAAPIPEGFENESVETILLFHAL